MDIETDLRPAEWALRAFWEALAGDDDLALLRITTERPQKDVGTGAGFCARYRARIKIGRDECRQMGRFAEVYVLPWDPPAVGFVCKDMEGHAYMEIPPTVPLIRARRPVMLLEADGRWRYGGMMGHPDWPEGTRRVELPLGPPKPAN
jgi:hypothetical protein